MLKTKTKSSKYAFFLLVILIPIFVYLMSFNSLIYNDSFVQKTAGGYWKYEGYDSMSSLVVNYLENPDEVGLIEIDAFTESEKQHLLDVKIVAHRIFDFSFLVMGVILGLLYVFKWDCRKVLVNAGMITIMVPILLYFIPFNFVFTGFHSIFFASGSWIFPSSSLLIKLYPFEFWKFAAFELFLRGFVTGWLLLFLSFIVGRK